MTPGDLIHAVEGHLLLAAKEVNRKAPDYAPDGVVFVDLIRQCAETNIADPRILLWALASKHTTAIRRYCTDGSLSSETLSNRVTDAINFFALIAVWHDYEHVILSTIYRHFADSNCDCPHPGIESDQDRLGEVCGRCEVMAWFHAHHASHTDSIL